MGAFWWLIVFIVLLILELITLGLTTIWFAVGAIVAFAASLCGGSFELQLALFVSVSFVLLFFTRPVLMKKINSKTVKTNVDELVGQLAKVTAPIDNLQASGAAMINGVEWTARSYDVDVRIEAGQMARIKEIKGVKLIVEPVLNQEQKDQAGPAI
jgi:membrane protein implicated in regulation of membrane protease activity